MRFAKLAMQVSLGVESASWTAERGRFVVCLFIQDTRECELLIIMGTSLKVQPFASLTDRYWVRLLIQLDKSETS